MPEPLDIFNLAEALGIEVTRKPLPDNVAGILHKFPGRSYLYLNSTHSFERQRFTVAHEIAHHVLDPAGTYLARDEIWTVRERRASQYAAQLLMPEAEVLRCLQRNMSISDMCRHFGVSEEAMRLRLDELKCRGLGGYREGSTREAIKVIMDDRN